MRGTDGTITAAGGATVALIARWAIRRSGSYPDGRPKLRFKAWFSWRSDVLLAMCGRGEMKARIRLGMLGKEGQENIDIVQWDEWRVDEDHALTLENIVHFDTQPTNVKTFAVR